MRKNGFVILTFVIALMLDILPLPEWAQWLRPSWTLLVLIFWVLAMPYRFSVGLAFLLGLFLDLLDGTLLGEHALAFVFITYIVVKLHKRWMFFPVIQQMMLIFMLLLLYKLFIFAFQGFVGDLPTHFLYWGSIFISCLLWPWLFVLLKDWQQRLSIGV